MTRPLSGVLGCDAKVSGTLRELLRAPPECAPRVGSLTTSDSQSWA